MALEYIRIYDILTGDTTYPHTGNFTIGVAGNLTIDDSDGSGDTIFGDNTDGDAADVPDQNVTSSTVSGIPSGTIVDSRYYYTVTGSDGSSGRVYFIATNQTNDYGPRLAANFELLPGVTYTFGTFNRQGAVPYNQLVPCFVRGTRIDTADGMIPVERLVAGNLVRTLDAGLQPIRWIGSRSLDAIDLALKPKLRPVVISVGALGENIPSKTLKVSPQHRILVRSQIAMRMFDTDEILVPAGKLIGLQGVEFAEDVQSVEYFHVLLDEHHIIFSEGAATESLYLGAQALKSLSPEARQEIADLWPDTEFDAAEVNPARELPLKGKRVLQLVERHLKNDSPLQ